MLDPRPVRKRIIALAQRLQKPGAGSSVVALRERTARVRFPDLTSVLEGIPWAAIGAVAARLYMPERSTVDLDIVVLATDAEAVRRRLSDAGFTYRGELGIGGSTWLSADGTPVDVVEMEEPWLEQQLAAAQHNRDAQGLPALVLEYQVLLKFRAGRVQDLADITRMLGAAGEEDLEARAFSLRHVAP